MSTTQAQVRVPELHNRLEAIFNTRSYWFEDKRYTVELNNVIAAIDFLDSRTVMKYPNLKVNSVVAADAASEYAGMSINEYEIVVAAELLDIPVSSSKTNNDPYVFHFNLDFEKVRYTDYYHAYEQFDDNDYFVDCIAETWKLAQGRYGWWDTVTAGAPFHKPTREYAETFAHQVMEVMDWIYFGGVKMTRCWSLRINTHLKQVHPGISRLAFMTAYVMMGKPWKFFRAKDGTVDIKTRASKAPSEGTTHEVV